MTGRPSDYSEEIAERLCDAIGQTARGLDFICNQNDDFPSARTVHRWLADSEPFRQRYVRARERQADLIFDECLEIADDASGDVKIVGEDEREVCNTEFVQRAKLRIETRMRMAGKLAPKKYGERVAHVGGDKDDPPIRTESKVDVSGLTDEQLRALASIRVPTE